MLISTLVPSSTRAGEHLSREEGASPLLHNTPSCPSAARTLHQSQYYSLPRHRLGTPPTCANLVARDGTADGLVRSLGEGGLGAGHALRMPDLA
jgi:hypothetical protein